MGRLTAIDIASTDISLEQQVSWHLQTNHYPPVPTSMVAPCIEAINAYHDEDYDREITLPEGVSYRGRTTAPASALVDAHHLDSWLDSNEDDAYLYDDEVQDDEDEDSGN
jgi:hypothetical protein